MRQFTRRRQRCNIVVELFTGADLTNGAISSKVSKHVDYVLESSSSRPIRIPMRMVGANIGCPGLQHSRNFGRAQHSAEPDLRGASLAACLTKGRGLRQEKTVLSSLLIETNVLDIRKAGCVDPQEDFRLVHAKERPPVLWRTACVGRRLRLADGAGSGGAGSAFRRENRSPRQVAPKFGRARGVRRLCGRESRNHQPFHGESHESGFARSASSQAPMRNGRTSMERTSPAPISKEPICSSPASRGRISPARGCPGRT